MKIDLIHEGAKYRAKTMLTPKQNASLTTVKRIGTGLNSVYVEYLDGQVAQFLLNADDYRPTVRNPHFIGFPLSVHWNHLDIVGAK